MLEDFSHSIDWTVAFYRDFNIVFIFSLKMHHCTFHQNFILPLQLKSHVDKGRFIVAQSLSSFKLVVCNHVNYYCLQFLFCFWLYFKQNTSQPFISYAHTTHEYTYVFCLCNFPLLILAPEILFALVKHFIGKFCC